MGNCECLRNHQDPSTEIHAEVKLKNFDDDYESTVRGRAKNVNNIILEDKDNGIKNCEPPVEVENVQFLALEEPVSEVNCEDFAVTFKQKKENPHVAATATSMHEEQIEDKLLDRSAISGESDIEGSKYP